MAAYMPNPVMHWNRKARNDMKYVNPARALCPTDSSGLMRACNFDDPDVISRIIRLTTPIVKQYLDLIPLDS